MTRMRLRTFLLLAATALVAGRIVCPKQEAKAAPEIGSGSFNLAAMNDVQSIYTSSTTPADWVGITVSVTAGSAQVERLVSGNWSSIGTVTAGASWVFEDQFN